MVTFCPDCDTELIGIPGLTGRCPSCLLMVDAPYSSLADLPAAALPVSVARCEACHHTAPRSGEITLHDGPCDPCNEAAAVGAYAPC